MRDGGVVAPGGLAMEDGRHSGSGWVRRHAGFGPVVSRPTLEQAVAPHVWVGREGAGPPAVDGGGVAVLADVRLHAGWVAALAGQDVEGVLDPRAAVVRNAPAGAWMDARAALALARVGAGPVAWDALDGWVTGECAGAPVQSTTQLALRLETLLDGLVQRDNAPWRACALATLGALMARLELVVPCALGDGRCVLWRDQAARPTPAPGLAYAYVDSNARAVVAVLDAAVVLGEPAARVKGLGALLALWDVAGVHGAVPHAVDLRGAVVAQGSLQDHAALVLALTAGHAHGGGQKLLELAGGLALTTQQWARPDGAMWGSGAQLGFVGPWRPWLWDGETPAADALWLEAQVLLAGALGWPQLGGHAAARAGALEVMAGGSDGPALGTLRRGLLLARPRAVVVHTFAGAAGRGAQNLADVVLKLRWPGLAVVHHVGPPGGSGPAGAAVCVNGQCSSVTASAEVLRGWVSQAAGAPVPDVPHQAGNPVTGPLRGVAP